MKDLQLKLLSFSDRRNELTEKEDDSPHMKRDNNKEEWGS